MKRLLQFSFPLFLAVNGPPTGAALDLASPDYCEL